MEPNKILKVLVTGANGYIGRHVVNALLERRCKVIACDYNEAKFTPEVTTVKMDILNYKSDNLYSDLGEPDVCIHMAWRNGFVHNSLTHMGDLSSHYNFLTDLINSGLPRLAVMGSMHEVGYWNGAIDENTPCNPMSMYGIAKDALRRSMIQYCQSHNCSLQWLRCYYVMGDDKMNNSIFAKILKSVEEGKKVFPFTSGKNQYDFIDVKELASIISEVVLQDKVTGIINCCSGKPISLGERVERFILDNNLDIKLEYGAYPDRPYDSPCVYGDVTKLAMLRNR